MKDNSIEKDISFSHKLIDRVEIIKELRISACI